MEDCEVAFDNRFTRAFGAPRERIRNKVRDALREPIKAFIAESPFLVMATSDCQGRCDALPKGGKLGFVRILDDQHLLIAGICEVVRVNGRVTRSPMMRRVRVAS
jgi:predicted pyridoxine 5'-phosphate oxidase superfamily flavin-nucleotide-binding protein